MPRAAILLWTAAFLLIDRAAVLHAQSFDPGRVLTHGDYERLTFDVSEVLALPHAAEPENLGRRWLMEIQLTGRRLDSNSPAWLTAATKGEPPSYLLAPRWVATAGLAYRFDFSVSAGSVGSYPAAGIGLKHLLVEGTPRAPGIMVGATAAGMWGPSGYFPGVAALFSHFCWRSPVGYWVLGARQLVIVAQGTRGDVAREEVRAPIFQIYLGTQWAWNVRGRNDIGYRADAALSRVPFVFSSGTMQLGQLNAGLYFRR